MIIIFKHNSNSKQYIFLGVIIAIFIFYTVYFLVSNSNNKNNTDVEKETTTITNITEPPVETIKENKAEFVMTTTKIVQTTTAPETTITSITTTQPTTTTPETTTTTASTTEQTTTTTTKATTAKTTTTTKSTTAETTTTTTKPVTTTTKSTETTETINSDTYILPYALTDDDWFMICKVVSSETGYCSERQQKAVAYTIFNRIIYAATHKNSPFPNSVYGILHQKNQYNAINYWRSDARLQPGGSLWNNTMRIIKEAANEPDFTNGAIGYYNPNMSGYLSAFENNSSLVFCYSDSTGRFFKLR